jgi:hypothetical protein
MILVEGIISRPIWQTLHCNWKDNFKRDFRSDQDHHLEKGSQIKSRLYIFFK